MAEETSDELVTKVQSALESLLSKKNLVRDQLLAGNMNPQMYIPIQILITHDKLNQAGATKEAIIKAAERSTKLGIDEGRLMVRPLLKSKRNIVILRDVPEGTTEEEVRSIFVGAPHCPEKLKSIQPEVNNNWFVKFDLDEGTQEVVLWLRSQTFKGAPVNASIKSEHFLRSFFPVNIPQMGMPVPGMPGAFDMGGLPPMDMGPPPWKGSGPKGDKGGSSKGGEKGGWEGGKGGWSAGGWEGGKGGWSGGGWSEGGKGSWGDSGKGGKGGGWSEGGKGGWSDGGKGGKGWGGAKAGGKGGSSWAKGMNNPPQPPGYWQPWGVWSRKQGAGSPMMPVVASQAAQFGAEVFDNVGGGDTSGKGKGKKGGGSGSGGGGSNSKWQPKKSKDADVSKAPTGVSLKPFGYEREFRQYSRDQIEEICRNLQVSAKEHSEELKGTGAFLDSPSTTWAPVSPAGGS